MVEEVEVGKQVSERTQSVSDTVRRTDVDVENLSDVPQRAGETPVRHYSGPERRLANSAGSAYSGLERRSNPY